MAVGFDRPSCALSVSNRYLRCVTAEMEENPLFCSAYPSALGTAPIRAAADVSPSAVVRRSAPLGSSALLTLAAPLFLAAPPATSAPLSYSPTALLVRCGFRAWSLRECVGEHVCTGLRRASILARLRQPRMGARLGFSHTPRTPSNGETP